MRQFHNQPPNVGAALQYASRRGWAVLPMHEKKFYTRDGVRIATRDPNIIKQWGWAESFGIACGEPSRTDVFDIDDADAFAAAGFDLDALAASTLAAIEHQLSGNASRIGKGNRIRSAYGVPARALAMPIDKLEGAVSTRLHL